MGSASAEYQRARTAAIHDLISNHEDEYRQILHDKKHVFSIPHRHDDQMHHDHHKPVSRVDIQLGVDDIHG